jgi:hypothetical protein
MSSSLDISTMFLFSTLSGNFLQVLALNQGNVYCRDTKEY